MDNSRFSIESNETLIWQQAPPSQFVNIKFYLIFGLGLFISLILMSLNFWIGLIGVLFFAFRIFDKYVEIRDSSYDLTHERLRIVSGGILTGRQTYEIHRSDLRDVKLNETYLQQLFKTGTLELIFNGDALDTYRDLVSKEKQYLVGVTNPQKSYEVVRAGIKETKNRENLNLEAYKLNLDKGAKTEQKYLNRNDTNMLE